MKKGLNNINLNYFENIDNRMSPIKLSVEESKADLGVSMNMGLGLDMKFKDDEGKGEEIKEDRDNEVNKDLSNATSLIDFDYFSDIQSLDKTIKESYSNKNDMNKIKKERDLNINFKNALINQRNVIHNSEVKTLSNISKLRFDSETNVIKPENTKIQTQPTQKSSDNLCIIF